MNTPESLRLVVTLNHEPGPDFPHFDLDLQLPAGLGAHCERLDTVESCTVERPDAGAYSIKVAWGDRDGMPGAAGKRASTAYQVAAIAVYANGFEDE